MSEAEPPAAMYVDGVVDAPQSDLFTEPAELEPFIEPRPKRACASTLVQRFVSYVSGASNIATP